VADFAGFAVSVISTATNTVTATVAFPVAFEADAVAVTPSGTDVYVTFPFKNQVSVIDAATNTVVSSIPVGREPFSIGLFIGGVPAAPAAITANAVPTLSQWAVNVLVLSVLVLGGVAARMRD
jgi:YVTN family beta-propeller protein